MYGDENLWTINMKWKICKKKKLYELLIDVFGKSESDPVDPEGLNCGGGLWKFIVSASNLLGMLIEVVWTFQ